MTFPALLDTCTLFGGALCDLTLELAEQGTFRPLWSEGILTELDRNLRRRGIPDDAVNYRIATMREAFPDALVEGYEDLVDQMRCDKKDRHVLAAAVRANAEVIVTFNLRDFPEESLQPYQIEAIHPDDFLLDQFDLYPAATIRAVEEITGRYEAPAMSNQEFLERIDKAGAPKFASIVRASL